MNSELEDLELDTLLEDLQKDSDELDKLYLRLDSINAELDKLLELDARLRKLESIKQINSIKRAFEVLTSSLDRPTIINKRKFFIVFNKFSSSLFKLKKLSKKIILINHFKHLIEIFQTIKHENHVVLLQPRLQAINSIRV